MKNRIKGIVLLMAIGMIAVACGEDGRDGRDGRDGFDGFDGNANVISTTYLVSPSEWNTVSFGAEVNRFNSDLTPEVIQTGLVSVFYSGDSDPASRRWIAIPYNGFGYSYLVNTITFEVYDATGAADNTWYKMVIIPQSAKVEGVDLNDFEAMKSVYGIE